VPIVISFIGQKGGVGKSTLARAVAVVAAQGELRVTLVDLDFRQQTSARWAETRRARARLQTIKAEPHRSFDEAFNANKEQDVIVIDTPGFITTQTIDIARGSHVVIVPTSSNEDDLYPTIMILNELSALGMPRSRLSAALCRVHNPHQEAIARKRIAESGYDALDGYVPERPEYSEAQNDGRSLTETGQQNLNEHAFRLIAGILRKILYQIREAQAS
jgi:chromosome partitioning protein